MTLREDVATAIDRVIGPNWKDLDMEPASLDVAAAAIAAVIEHLAKEAEKGIVRSFRDPNDARMQTRRNIGPGTAEWLRTYLPAEGGE